MPHDMNLEEIIVDIPTLWESHGDHNINNLTTSQLIKLLRNMVKGKVVCNSQGAKSIDSRNMGIKKNPPKA
jgi:hypothetical protein